jgi:methyl-accepting chemotaxis protein
VRLVQDTGASLQAIGLHVATINQHMDAIAISAREQSVGLSEVNTAVNQMDQVTQRNAAMVEETNAASASLANEAVRLRDQISRFVLPSVSGGMRDLKAVHRRMETAARMPSRPAALASHGNAALKQEWTEF